MCTYLTKQTLELLLSFLLVLIIVVGDGGGCWWWLCCCWSSCCFCFGCAQLLSVSYVFVFVSKHVHVYCCYFGSRRPNTIFYCKQLHNHHAGAYFSTRMDENGTYQGIQHVFLSINQRTPRMPNISPRPRSMNVTKHGFYEYVALRLLLSIFQEMIPIVDMF